MRRSRRWSRTTRSPGTSSSGRPMPRRRDPPTGSGPHSKCRRAMRCRRTASSLAGRVGATGFRVMPAKCLFALGVGHVRRKTIEPGSRADELGEVISTQLVELVAAGVAGAGAAQARVHAGRDSRRPMAGSGRGSRRDAGGVLPRGAHGLAERGVIGRFSTFLEHVKPSQGGERVTRYNALFHWRVPRGPGDRRGARSRAAPHHHARLLARRRARDSAT